MHEWTQWSSLGAVSVCCEALRRVPRLFVMALALTAGGTASAQQDMTSPEVIAVQPIDGATAVPVNLTSVSVTFSEDMDQASFLNHMFVEDATGARLAIGSSGGARLAGRSSSLGCLLRNRTTSSTLRLGPWTSQVIPWSRSS